MRRMVYLPNHLLDRVRVYKEKRNIEEPVALMRLVSIGLDKVAEEEDEPRNGQANDALVIYR